MLQESGVQILAGDSNGTDTFRDNLYRCQVCQGAFATSAEMDVHICQQVPPPLGLQYRRLSAAQTQCPRVPAQLAVWPMGNVVTTSAARSGVRQLPQMQVRMLQLPVPLPMLMVPTLPVRTSARSLPRLPMAPRPAV